MNRYIYSTIFTLLVLSYNFINILRENNILMAMTTIHYFNMWCWFGFCICLFLSSLMTTAVVIIPRSFLSFSLSIKHNLYYSTPWILIVVGILQPAQWVPTPRVLVLLFLPTVLVHTTTTNIMFVFSVISIMSTTTSKFTSYTYIQQLQIFV